MQHLVVIGTSAGGIEALMQLTSRLPRHFAAPIAVVMHTAPESPGILPDILSRNGNLPARHARSHERLQRGNIYVAPPGHHLLVEPNRACLSRGPRENRFRPAIDPLFRSAAQVYGPAAIGVILTGNLDDGTAGLSAIKKLGGTAVVQAPEDAMFPSMPQSAVERVKCDYIVPLAAIPDLLVRLTTMEVEEIGVTRAPDDLDVAVRIAKEEDPMDAGVNRLGSPSSIACPECHGVLRQWEDEGHLLFRCHTGHAYSADSLVADIDQAIEAALWNAIRALQEGSMALQLFSQRGPTGEHAAHLSERAETLKHQADYLRNIVMKEPTAER